MPKSAEYHATAFGRLYTLALNTSIGLWVTCITLGFIGTSGSNLRIRVCGSGDSGDMASGVGCMGFRMVWGSGVWAWVWGFSIEGLSI